MSRKSLIKFWIAATILGTSTCALAQNNTFPPVGQPKPVQTVPFVAPQQPSSPTRTVEVTTSGESPEVARTEATRQAIQQVAGVFVDNRRRVEINMSGQRVSEIVQEKILSYTQRIRNEI
jgi:hypothetical protein